jgi:Arc/MetJ-type ribon-helix-helix transcriptional regulator
MTTRSRAGTDSRKQAVSIRMSRNDVKQIKRLAERLGARDSDVVRFAVKMMLGRLAPLNDPAACGRALVPMLVESGTELMRHFDLDASRLSGIVNNGAEADRRVDPEDIQLLAMSGVQRSYVKLHIAGLRRHLTTEVHDASGLAKPLNPQAAQAAEGAVPGNAATGPAQGAGAVAGADARRDLDGHDTLDFTLRQYLCDKYLYAAPAADESKTTRGGL